jgi:hypothetical protein
VVEADIFTDGHDVLSAVLCYRWARDTVWTEVAMAPLGNDRWQGRLACPSLDVIPTVYRLGWTILPPGMRHCTSGWRQHKRCRSSS